MSSLAQLHSRFQRRDTTIGQSPIFNVLYGLLHNLLIGPVFYAGGTVTSTSFLDMIENFIYIQSEKEQPAVVFQQDQALPHWILILRAYVNQHFPNRRICRARPISWPARSPDMTPFDFFYWDT
jgi:hypothetical protein